MVWVAECLDTQNGKSYRYNGQIHEKIITTCFVYLNDACVFSGVLRYFNMVKYILDGKQYMFIFAENRRIVYFIFVSEGWGKAFLTVY